MPLEAPVMRTVDGVVMEDVLVNCVEEMAVMITIKI
jgi:hypothetical protein